MVLPTVMMYANANDVSFGQGKLCFILKREPECRCFSVATRSVGEKNLL
ncbi:MAG: hypothetical protein IIU65_03750 [Clostridia bacterium]|nr:hypothetical protein [Clostridia bacterium]